MINPEPEPTYPLCLDPVRWATFLAGRTRPPMVPYPTWYRWTQGTSAPPLPRLAWCLKQLDTAEGFALKHLGWDGLPNVGSVLALEAWVAKTRHSLRRQRLDAEDARRAAEGLPLRTKNMVYVQLHRDRKAYLKYMKEIQPNEEGESSPVLPKKIKDVVITVPMRCGLPVRPPDPPPYDLSKIEGYTP